MKFLDLRHCNGIKNNFQIETFIYLLKYVNLWWHSKDLNTQKQILILHGYLDIPKMIQVNYQRERVRGLDL